MKRSVLFCNDKKKVSLIRIVFVKSSYLVKYLKTKQKQVCKNGNYYFASKHESTKLKIIELDEFIQRKTFLKNYFLDDD